MQKLKVLELFGGIGAIISAMKNKNKDFEVVDYIEIDKYAVASYNAMYNGLYNTQDICKWNKFPHVDLMVGGFPCQDVSLAGKQAGIIKGETRSGLMYEMMRVISLTMPKHIITENVKGLLTKRHKPQLEEYLAYLEELGYTNSYDVLNSVDYGAPQDRRRVIIISSINGKKFDFSELKTTKQMIPLEDILEDNVDNKYFASNKMIEKLKRHNNKIINGVNPLVSSTIHAGYYKMGGRDQQYIIDNGKIRRFTPRECWRLQSFSDELFDKACNVNSDTQLYKQAGNTINVAMLESIVDVLFKT